MLGLSFVDLSADFPSVGCMFTTLKSYTVQLNSSAETCMAGVVSIPVPGTLQRGTAPWPGGERLPDHFLSLVTSLDWSYLRFSACLIGSLSGYHLLPGW